MAETKTNSQSTAAAAFAVFAVLCVVAFLAFRGGDVGQLPKLIGNLGGGPLAGFEGFRNSAAGTAVAILIGVSWFGLGSFAARFIKIEKSENHSHVLEIARNTAVGAAIWSLIWFVLGLFNAYLGSVAIALLAVGVIFAAMNLSRLREAKTESRVSEKPAGIDRLVIGLIAIPLVLTFLASLAPPTAKDTLLYHLSVPKAFVAQHGNGFIEGNIASYLALGTEMHSVWAMLIGGFLSSRAAEAAAGAASFLFFPLVLMTIFGWAREIGISRQWSLAATAMVASVPTAFYVASSDYIDLELAIYVTLAVAAVSRWWRTGKTGPLVFMAIFLGAALSVKLTALFVFAAVALIILLRAREVKNPVAVAPGSDSAAALSNPGKVVFSGLTALVIAGAIASPWYLRTWRATGSPVFPFYMSMWKGDAAGWDVERSNLFQAMNSQYGGADVNKLNYITAPVRASIMAQPEQAEYYDGVLGVAFLIGLPILIWALWKFDLPVEVKIAAGVVGIMYVFWLFSSEQLRYLLPILPALAVTIAAAAERISEKQEILKKVWQYSFAAAAVAGILTTAAWFCQKAPLRAALGGETRDDYLAKNLDYYQYYQALNSTTSADAKVWLIDMRRDTYNIDRPVFSDYLFEDVTFKKMLWESRSVQELRAKAAATGAKYVLTRHDFLFDYDKSTLVDDKRPRAENEAKLKIAKDFILDPANTIKSDNKFSLIKVFSEK